MKRDKFNTNNKDLANMAKLQTLSTLTNRMALGQQLGLQYNGDRDIYEALGYPKTITFEVYYGKYRRDPMAKAVINRPVKTTWRGQLQIVEAQDAEVTQFEAAWNELDEMLKLQSKFSRVDKLAGIGCYGVLLLGLDDVKNSIDWINPVAGKRKLLYVKPYSQKSATILEYESNPTNPRYGKPKIYGINVQEDTTISNGVANVAGVSVSVHYSRVIHVVGEVLESDVLGTPRLEAVYNNIMNLEKIVGGDPEMFWRGARPGYTGNVSKDFQMTPATKTDLQDQIDEYEGNLRRLLVTEGVDFKALSQQIANPKDNVLVQVQMISAETGIPIRILLGSERGELASGQDAVEYKEMIQDRRDDFAEPNVVRPFIDRMIMFGVLPKPKDGTYTVIWSNLLDMTEAQKVKNGKERAASLKSWADSLMASQVVPPKMFFKYFLRFDDEEVEMIMDAMGEMEALETVVTKEENDIMELENNVYQLPKRDKKK